MLDFYVLEAFKINTTEISDTSITNQYQILIKSIIYLLRHSPFLSYVYILFDGGLFTKDI